MRPRILLLDEPHPKARAIMEEVAWLDDVDKCTGKTLTLLPIDCYDIVYTQLTPIKTDKIVFCPCTGIDHIKAPKIIHLDSEWKANEGREITSTAEHAWSLLLQLAKLNKMQLKGKVLGIIGFGRIGKQVFEYAKAFRMEIHWYDKYMNSLDILLQLCDIITLHIPLNDSTRGMIGEAELAIMKPGALLINTSRKDIVDTKALFKALGRMKISYADDFRNEYSDYALLPPNMISTPHVGGNCVEAREATDCYIATKIKEYIEKEMPR